MKRVRWGRERRLQKAYALDHKGEACPDCRTEWKALHDPGCSVEECPYCGHSLFECSHRKRFWKGWKPKVEEEKKGFFAKLLGWGSK